MAELDRTAGTRSGRGSASRQSRHRMAGDGHAESPGGVSWLVAGEPGDGATAVPARTRRRPFRLLAISHLATLPGPDGATGAGDSAAAAWFTALAAAGVDALQLREKQLADRALYHLARQARGAFPGPARLLVNGRADLALTAGADGVHLPADGVPAGALRAGFGNGLLIGVSTHRLDEVEQARRDGADYVVFGPIYSTPTKAALGAPAGLPALARAAGLGIPVYALGGVTLDRFAEVAMAGAAGVAAVRLFQRLDELEQVVAVAGACFP